MLLPHPDQAALQQSTELLSKIRHEIALAGNSLPFSRYMALALYDETHGYYCTRTPFGPEGDFVTAPELTPLFARCIAETCRLIGGDIVEYGAGSGVFARDLLTALADTGHLPAHYWIIEKSPRCRSRQAALLQASCPPEWLARIHWVDTPPEKIHGVIFANEVLDALPFDCFLVKSGQLHERRVSWQDNRLNWCLAPATPPCSSLLADLPPLPEGYQSEIRPALAPFVQSQARHLQEGLLLLVDYGYGRETFFHPERRKGTLSCFYHHRRHDDPFLWPGLQDITAHVDFTTVAEAAEEAGLFLTGFTSQAAFLLGSGLMQMAEASSPADPTALWQQAEALRTLLLPDEMGEVIKVAGFSTDPTLSLPGFALKDCRQDL